MSVHIYPVPQWCVVTQTFPEHNARAVSQGLCYRPGSNCRGYYYGGLDLAPPYSRANEDVPVRASAGGKVTVQNDPSGYGLNVRILTDDGELVILGHLIRTTVQSGQRVNQGDQVGWMGSTGNSTGKHTHWEIRVNDIPVDPVSKMVDTNPQPEPKPEPEPNPEPTQGAFDDLEGAKPVFCQVAVNALSVRTGPDDDNRLYPRQRLVNRGSVLPVLEQVTNAQGEKWLRIGYREWICYQQGSSTYVIRHTG